MGLKDVAGQIRQAAGQQQQLPTKRTVPLQTQQRQVAAQRPDPATAARIAGAIQNARQVRPEVPQLNPARAAREIGGVPYRAAQDLDRAVDQTRFGYQTQPVGTPTDGVRLIDPSGITTYVPPTAEHPGAMRRQGNFLGDMSVYPGSPGAIGINRPDGGRVVSLGRNYR